MLLQQLPWLGPLLRPSLGQEDPTITCPPPCHVPGPELSRAKQKLLCSPWSCREVLPESLTVLFTSVLCCN